MSHPSPAGTPVVTNRAKPKQQNSGATHGGTKKGKGKESIAYNGENKNHHNYQDQQQQLSSEYNPMNNGTGGRRKKKGKQIQESLSPKSLEQQQKADDNDDNNKSVTQQHTNKKHENQQHAQQPQQYTVSKNSFQPRASHFDIGAESSTLRNSEFRGFFNLALISGFFFVFASNARQLLVEG